MSIQNRALAGDVPDGSDWAKGWQRVALATVEGPGIASLNADSGETPGTVVVALGNLALRIGTSWCDARDKPKPALAVNARNFRGLDGFADARAQLG